MYVTCITCDQNWSKLIFKIPQASAKVMSDFLPTPLSPHFNVGKVCAGPGQKQKKHVCANIEFGGAGVEADPEKSDITFAEGGATKK